VPAEMKISEACFSAINWNSLSRIMSRPPGPLCFD
jgi:hypothetical protein